MDINKLNPLGVRGERVTPLYKPYRYVPPQRVDGFWAFLVCKRVYTLPILVWNRGMVFEGTTGVYERIYRFNSKPIREIEICEFEMHLKNFLFAIISA